MNEPATTSPARRYRPRLLPTVATVAGIALFVTAGQWQQNRMEQKQALRAQFDAAVAMAPAALPQDVSDWSAWRYRPIAAEGVFDAAKQILIDNKINEGRAGYHVVTPLELTDGRVVLVNRGWVAQGASRTELPAVAAPAGAVTLEGRIAVPAAGYLELKPEAAPGAVWQNLDPARFAAATGVTVLPVVIEQTAAPVPDDGLVRDWTAPDFGIDKHRIYMVQWYAFAALAIALWLILNFRRSPRPDHA